LGNPINEVHAVENHTTKPIWLKTTGIIHAHGYVSIVIMPSLSIQNLSKTSSHGYNNEQTD
jgi:hypothetical protein